MKSRAARPLATIVVLLAACVLAGCTSAPKPVATSNDAQPPGKSTTSPSPSVTIEPVIVVAAVDVDGQHVTASGYVQGVVEDGGTCAFAFSNENAQTVTVDHSATADRSSTACGAVQPEIGDFDRGTWTVTLTYTSARGTFRSQPQTLEVP